MATRSELPLVGIVLVNYNGAKFMPACIETILNGSYKEIKLIVVDNLSTDGSREWLGEQGPEIEKVLLPSNTGITGGNNAGIKRCLELGCDEVFILNNDTELKKDTISELVKAREPKRLLVPRIYFFDQPTVINTNFGGFNFITGRSTHLFYGQPDSPASEQTTLGTMTSTCALLVPKAVFEEVGLMDENFFIYYDDTDFVARAVKAGYLVKYVPSAVLFHKESMSSGGQRLGSLPLYYLTRNRLYFMEKHQTNKLKLALFKMYFWLTQGLHLLKFALKKEFAARHAIKTGIEDFRANRLGFTEGSRYRLP